MRSKENLIGAWAFLIGVILAVAVGVFQNNLQLSTSNTIYALLVLTGLLVGILNVSDDDSSTFLIASLALVIASGLGRNTLSFISNLNSVLFYLSSVMSALLVMFIPATIVVALKTVFGIARR